MHDNRLLRKRACSHSAAAVVSMPSIGSSSSSQTPRSIKNGCSVAKKSHHHHRHHLHNRDGQCTDDVDDDADKSQSSASSLQSMLSGGPARRNKPSGGGSGAIDEEEGYDCREAALLLPSAASFDVDDGKSAASIRHGNDEFHRHHNHGNSKCRDKGRGNEAATDDDDTKNDQSHDARSRKLFLKTAFWISCWYVTSLATLFLNKIILTRPGSSVHVLGMCQMSAACVLGGFSAHGGFARLLSKLERVCSFASPPGGGGEGGRSGPLDSHGRGEGFDDANDGAAAVGPSSSPPAAGPVSAGYPLHFVRDMSVVGLLRGLTVVLGLVSLEHVPVSFVETIKATAPVFTVIFARLILKEHTAVPVMLTLVPVVAGLILCSAFELSFNAVGFVAAVLNNCADCVQNVMSKRLLAHLKPTQLQFYTSVAALALQSPLLLRDAGGWVRAAVTSHHAIGGVGDVLAYDSLHQLAGDAVGPGSAVEAGADGHASYFSLGQLLLIDAVFYHLQSVSAYCTMGCMSPVSQSVANTLKRSLLVWASIIYFGNPVTSYGIFGMAMVVTGVFMYNHARKIYQS